MSAAGTGIAVRTDSGGRDVLFTDMGCICEFPVRRLSPALGYLII